MSARAAVFKPRHEIRRQRLACSVRWILLLFLLVYSVISTTLTVLWEQRSILPGASYFRSALSTVGMSTLCTERPIQLLVFLPLVGVRQSGLESERSTLEERLAIQSWGLAARQFVAVAPSGSSIRIFGMVSLADQCDLWITKHMRKSLYSCHVLPAQCAQHEHGSIPFLKCTFEAAIAAADSNDVLVYASRDSIMTSRFTPAMLDVHRALACGEGAPGNTLPKLSNAVLVGRQARSKDFQLEQQLPTILTYERLEEWSDQALGRPAMLDRDLGIDLLIFPRQLFPRGFQWEDFLLPSFTRNGAKVINITETMPLLRASFDNGVSDSARTEPKGYHGAFGMLGRLTYADYVHVLRPHGGAYHLSPRMDETADGIGMAIAKAATATHDMDGDTESWNPFLLLVTVTSVKDLIWAEKWLGVESKSSGLGGHFVFLTHDEEVHGILNAKDPGRTILETRPLQQTPSLALNWFTFWKLAIYNVAVAIVGVQDFDVLFMAADPPSIAHWRRDCDVLLRRSNGNPHDVLGAQPSAAPFLEMVRECYSSSGRRGLMAQQPGTFASIENHSMTAFQCGALLVRTFTLEEDAVARGGHAHGIAPIRACQVPVPKEAKSAASNGMIASSQPYDFVKEALASAAPIAHKLHMILSVSNPAGYESRYRLARDFIERIERYDKEHVELYVVELAYGDQGFNITQASNPRHLQLRTRTVLWHKENLLNLGVERLLPGDWKALAWADAEIEFESPTWAGDTLRLLNGFADVVQLFSHGADLDQDGRATKVYTGFGYNYLKGIPYQKEGVDLWHPGYAWACTREAYDQFGGFFEGNILGGSDQSTAYAVMGMHRLLPDTLKMFPSPGYRQAVLDWEARFEGLRMGYVPGVVKHHYHGSVKDRKYWERRDLLSDAGYDPLVHVHRDDQTGVLVPTAVFPPALADRIREYFASRHEDAGERQPQQAGVIDRPVRSRLVRSEHSEDSEPNHLLHAIILVYPPPAHDTITEKHYHLLVADYLQRFTAGIGPHRHARYYVVELAHGSGDRRGHKYRHTDASNGRHLQLPLPAQGTWSKASVLNLAIRQLLPSDWETVAYVDVGCEFDSMTWASDALKLLDRHAYDAVQLFSHAVSLGVSGNTTWIREGFGYSHILFGKPVDTSLLPSSNSWCSGMAWAYSRRLFDSAAGALFEEDVFGRFDFDEGQAWSLLARKGLEQGEGDVDDDAERLPETERGLARWRSDTPRLGYVPGVARRLEIFSQAHHYHHHHHHRATEDPADAASVRSEGPFANTATFDSNNHLADGAEAS